MDTCEGLVRGGVASCGVDVTWWWRDASGLAGVSLGANVWWLEFCMLAGSDIVVGMLCVRDVSLGDVVLRCVVFFLGGAGWLGVGWWVDARGCKDLEVCAGVRGSES